MLGAAADFGFSMMLSRDLGQSSDTHRPLLRSAYQVASVWSAILALVMVAIAFSDSLSSQRGQALLVLSPAMAFNGLNPARAIFLVRFETRRMILTDTVVGIFQATLCMAAAAANFGPVGVAAVVSAAGIVDNVVVAVLANRMLEPQAGVFSRRQLIRRAVPLGVMNVMTKVYLSIDVVILAWYVRSADLGDYAAAVKMVSIIVGFAAVAMTGALPGLAQTVSDTAEQDRLLLRLWHWMVFAGVPLFAAAALFSPLVVQLGLGGDYAGATSLLRVLSLAGVITLLSNLVGNVQIARHLTRQLLIQNALAIAVNISANLVLIPHFGVYAAAWVTVGTEIGVCGSAVFSLRRQLPWRQLCSLSFRPLVTVALAGIAGLLLPLSPGPDLAVCCGIFAASTCLLKSYPAEIPSLIASIRPSHH